jgi:hypothetical protein
VKFITIMLWDSTDAILATARPDYEAAAIPEERRNACPGTIPNRHITRPIDAEGGKLLADAMGRPSWRSSFLGDPGANFSVPATMF